MSRASWIEMTTTSIAGTNGDGAVTMTAIASIPTFTNAFGSGSREIPYTIEDTTSGAYKFEEGKGIVAANVLTRSRVLATWNGTTYDDTAPTALAFGATPTTGVIRIRIAPHAHEFIQAPAGIVTGLSGDTYDGYQLNAASATNQNPTNNLTLATSTEYYAAFLCLIRGQVDGFMLEVGTAGAGGTGIKAGVYEVASDGLPGPNITRFNAVSCASTGVKTDTTPGTWAGNAGPLRFGVGWYYIGFMTDGTPSLFTFPNAFIYPPLGRKNLYGFGGMLSKTAENSYATGLPTGTPSGTYTIPGYWPLLGLKITN